MPGRERDPWLKKKTKKKKMKGKRTCLKKKKKKKKKIKSSTGGAKIESARHMNTSAPFLCLQIAKDVALREAKYNNFVFSPCSIQLALSLLANIGANGLPLDELLTFLEAEDLNQLNSVNEKLVKLLNSNAVDGKPILSSVSGVWNDKCFPLKPTFITTVQNVYNGRSETVDFQGQAQLREVILQVNKWIENNTNGCIKSLLPDMLPPSTRLFLANALYFKGKWMQHFNKRDTRNEEFYLLGNSVKVPFMTNHEEQYVTVFKDFKVLRLCYIGGFSMYIILPNKIDGLWDLTEKVGSDPSFLENDVRRDTYSIKLRRFKVPKFKITYAFNAVGILKGIGLDQTLSFRPELNEMTLSPNPPLRVSHILHKSVIVVNEEGTEAAASTVVVLEKRSSHVRRNPTVDFVANHPFMFMVRDDDTGTVLFMGHVVNPVQI